MVPFNRLLETKISIPRRIKKAINREYTIIITHTKLIIYAIKDEHIKPDVTNVIKSIGVILTVKYYAIIAEINITDVVGLVKVDGEILKNITTTNPATPLAATKTDGNSGQIVTEDQIKVD